MDFLRIFLAVLTFLLGCYLIFDLISEGFDLFVLCGSLLSFIFANFLWPKNHNQENGIVDSLDIIDLLEFVIRVPFRAVAYLLRGIGRIGRDVDDIDLS